MSGLEVKLSKFSVAGDGSVEVKSPELLDGLIKDTEVTMSALPGVSLDDISVGEFGELRIKNEDYTNSIKEMMENIEDFDALAVKNGACGAGC